MTDLLTTDVVRRRYDRLLVDHGLPPLPEPLQFDHAEGIAVINGMTFPLDLSEEERETAMLEPLDERWCVGQHLQAIGPPGHPKHTAAHTKVLAVLADGYRVAKYPGCASEFIHNNAQRMWIPVIA